MKLDVQDVITSILERWLQEKQQSTISLVTEDVTLTVQMLSLCLDRIWPTYQVLGNLLIVGNKKIWVYQQELL